MQSYRKILHFFLHKIPKQLKYHTLFNNRCLSTLKTRDKNFGFWKKFLRFSFFLVFKGFKGFFV